MKTLSRLMKTQSRLMKKVVMMKVMKKRKLSLKKMMKKRKLMRIRRKPRRMRPVSIPQQSITTISISSREQKQNWTLGEPLFQSQLTPRRMKLQLTFMTSATVLPTLIALKLTLRIAPRITQRITPRIQSLKKKMKVMKKHLHPRRKIRKRTPFHLFSTR